MPRFPVRRRVFWIALIPCTLALAGTLLATGQRRDRDQGNPRSIDPALVPSSEPADSMSHKQKQEFLKFKLENMRKDAAEMAELAGSIQGDLAEVTENELPLRVVEKAGRVEKLAKKIKNAAKGY